MTTKTLINGHLKRYYEFGAYRLDPAKRRLLRAGEVLPLPPKAFDLLLVLVEHQGQVIDKEDLLQAVWPDTVVEEANLSVSISVLRKTLGEAPNERQYIETLPRRGYRFIPSVREVEEPHPGVIHPQPHPSADVTDPIEPAPQSSAPTPLQPDVAPALNSVMPQRDTRFRRSALIALPLIVLIALGGFFWWRSFTGQQATALPTKIVPLTSYPGREFAPAFSPDGNQLAFVWGGEKDDNLDVYVRLIDGGSSLRLTTHAADDINPVWTPDGREIIFSSRRGGTQSLWRISATGDQPTWLSVGGYNISGPAFSRNSQQMAWTQSTGDANIWRLGLVGVSGQSKPATQFIASTFTDTDPQYSPDGKRIVFSSNRSGNFEIWACGSEGETPTQLTSFRGAHVGTLRWSPDGRQVVFDGRTEGNPDIFIVSSEGGKPRRLTAEPADDVLPSWSHDGRWIYFASNRSGQMQIWKMPATGQQEAIQVTKQSGFEGFESADGQWLYYTKGRGLSAIWRVPVDGGTEAPIFDFQQPGYSRVWALAGDGIYFAATDSYLHPMIKFFRFATGQMTTVATIERGLPQGVSGLAVSPDGRWLLYPQIEQQGSDIILMENFR